MGILKESWFDKIAIGYIGLNVLAGAFVMNFLGASISGRYVDRDVLRSKLEHVKKQVSFYREHFPGSDLDNIGEKVGGIRVDDQSLVEPFWSLPMKACIINSYQSEIESIIEESIDGFRDSAEKHIKVGVAVDSRDEDLFETAVKLSNTSMIVYGVFASVGETADVSLPDEFTDKELAYGVKGSFPEPMDHYFVWSAHDYKRGDIDYCINSLTSENLTLVDDSVETCALGRIVAREIARVFSENEDTIICPQDLNDYLNDTPEIEDNKIALSRVPYDISLNMGNGRIVKLCVGLDGVRRDEAGSLVAGLSREYEKMFNISFEPVEFVHHKLPDSWQTSKEMHKVRDKSKEAADIYLLLTDTSYTRADLGPLSSLAGQASTLGYSWVTVGPDNSRNVKTLGHEFGHLFGAGHIYIKDTIMHPEALEMRTWSNLSRETILSNKFRTWEWSSNEAEDIKESCP